jgi:putative inorganic carbon (hco3(-)) transporter
MPDHFKTLWVRAADLAERYGEYVFYGFIFFMAVGNAGAEIFAGLLLLCFILKKSVKPDFSFLKDRAHIFLLLFFIFSAASLIHSGPFLKKSLIALFLKWMKFCAIFLVTEDFFRSERGLRRGVTALLFVAGIIGLDVMAQFFLGSDLFYHSPLVPILHNEKVVFKAVTATFGHGNDLGAYLVPVSLLAVSLLIDGRTRRTGWFLILLPLLLGASLALTFSRGAWVGFFFGFVLMLVLSRRYKTSILLLLISMGIFLLFPDIRERIAYTLRPEGDSLRRPVWEASFQLIRAHPFIGSGIGTFMDQCNQLLPKRLTYAHNCYLQMWVETGAFSLLAFLLFLGTVLYNGVTAYLKNQDPVLLGILCGILGFLVHSFFDTQFYALRLAYLLWFLVGLLAAVTRLKQDIGTRR